MSLGYGKDETQFEIGLGRHRIYKELVKLMFEQMRRPYDTNTVTAFEIVVTQNSPTMLVKYCQTCENRASRQLKAVNSSVGLCSPCFAARKSHIHTAHRQ